MVVKHDVKGCPPPCNHRAARRWWPLIMFHNTSYTPPAAAAAASPACLPTSDACTTIYARRSPDRPTGLILINSLRARNAAASSFIYITFVLASRSREFFFDTYLPTRRIPSFLRVLFRLPLPLLTYLPAFLARVFVCDFFIFSATATRSIYTYRLLFLLSHILFSHRRNLCFVFSFYLFTLYKCLISFQQFLYSSSLNNNV